MHLWKRVSVVVLATGFVFVSLCGAGGEVMPGVLMRAQSIPCVTVTGAGIAGLMHYTEAPEVPIELMALFDPGLARKIQCMG